MADLILLSLLTDAQEAYKSTVLNIERSSFHIMGRE